MMSAFRALMVDPPWPYRANEPGIFKASAGIGASARHRYGLMTLADLAALPVGEIAAPDGAHLYLWCTNRFVEQAHALARGWGFGPVTLITWVKPRRDGRPSAGGTGYYFRNCTEHMIFAVRGSLRTDQAVTRPTAYLWPRTPHSVKPEASYRLIEAASPGPRIELFARRQRPGWTCLGDAIDGQDIRSAVASVLASDSGPRCAIDGQCPSPSIEAARAHQAMAQGGQAL